MKDFLINDLWFDFFLMDWKDSGVVSKILSVLFAVSFMAMTVTGIAGVIGVLDGSIFYLLFSLAMFFATLKTFLHVTFDI